MEKSKTAITRSSLKGTVPKWEKLIKAVGQVSSTGQMEVGGEEQNENCRSRVR